MKITFSEKKTKASTKKIARTKCFLFFISTSFVKILEKSIQR